MSRARLLLFPLLLSCSSSGTPDLSHLAGMDLRLANGSSALWPQLRGSKATVFITLDPDCPFCQGYAPLIDSLSRHFADDGVRFCGLYPSVFMDADSVSRFASEHEFSFPQVMDHDCVIANMLRARVTPECFVLDSTDALVYVGAIDDWAVRAGKHKSAATRHWLSDAITSSLNGDKVPEGDPAVGCIVECDDRSKQP